VKCRLLLVFQRVKDTFVIGFCVSVRDILNLAPLPEPYGSQIPARGEYYDITDPPEDKQPAEDENGGDTDGNE
jgi:hypothetical protein